MRYKLLGRSGLRVSELCLGTMTFGEDWGWGASREESRRVFDAYAEAGGNFLDTACNYTNGTSERLLGQFTGPNRDRFVIATKYSLTQRADDPNGGGNSRKNLVQTLEDSLERLATDYVDILYVHMWDFSTPVDEVMRALDDVIREGKVRYAAVSDTPSWIVSRANMLADLRGASPFVALQLPYSLLRRDAERSEIPMADTLDLAVLAWAVLGAGVLTGKYNDPAKRPSGTRLSEGKWGTGALSERNLGIAAAVAGVAEEVGRPSSQVALNWVRQRRGGVTIPIIAATKLAQIQDNLACVEFTLSDEHMERLNEASAFERGFPLDFLEGDNVQQLVHGDARASLDPHRRSG